MGNQRRNRLSVKHLMATDQATIHLTLIKAEHPLIKAPRIKRKILSLMEPVKGKAKLMDRKRLAEISRQWHPRRDQLDRACQSSLEKMAIPILLIHHKSSFSNQPRKQSIYLEYFRKLIFKTPNAVLSESKRSFAFEKSPKFSNSITVDALF